MNKNKNNILTYRDGQIKCVQQFLKRDEADKFFTCFLSQISWEESYIRLFGKELLIPRKQCWIADEGISYSYSKKTLKRHPWSEELLKLRDRIEKFSNEQFNSVLANLYRNGKDSMGWHSDNESELGNNPVIASLSLGAERSLKVRDNKTREIIQIPQKHGSLLLMRQGMQLTTQHSIAKTNIEIGARINLTFRNIISTNQKEQR